MHSHLEGARAEVHLDIVISDDRARSLGARHAHFLAYILRKALVLWVDTHSRVT